MIIPYNKNITKLKNNYYITAPITVYQTCHKFSVLVKLVANLCDAQGNYWPWKKIQQWMKNLSYHVFNVVDNVKQP